MKFENHRYTAPLGLLLGFFLLILPDASLAQEAGRARLFQRFYEDLGPLAQQTVQPRTGLYVLGGAGLTAGLAWLDDDIQDGMHDIYTGAFKDALETADYFGGPRINLPVVLVAGGSLLTNNTKFQDAAFTSLQTLVYAGLLGYVLKGIFGRDRPENTDDPYAFFATTGKNPFSHEGNSSYPSGHAISSFGIITPWVYYYPSVFTYGLYLIPTGTTLNRLAKDKHWATDIVIGAAIGVAMGRWLSIRHQDRQHLAQRLDLNVGPQSIGVRVQF